MVADLARIAEVSLRLNGLPVGLEDPPARLPHPPLHWLRAADLVDAAGLPRLLEGLHVLSEFFVSLQRLLDGLVLHPLFLVGHKTPDPGPDVLLALAKPEMRFLVHEGVNHLDEALGHRAVVEGLQLFHADGELRLQLPHLGAAVDDVFLQGLAKESLRRRGLPRCGIQSPDHLALIHPPPKRPGTCCC